MANGPRIPGFSKKGAAASQGGTRKKFFEASGSQRPQRMSSVKRPASPKPPKTFGVK